jgi:hypothetical protein
VVTRWGDPPGSTGKGWGDPSWLSTGSLGKGVSLAEVPGGNGWVALTMGAGRGDPPDRVDGRGARVGATRRGCLPVRWVEGIVSRGTGEVTDGSPLRWARAEATRRIGATRHGYLPVCWAEVRGVIDWPPLRLAAVHCGLQLVVLVEGAGLALAGG